MTTYLLHGGRTSILNPQNEKFFGKFAELVDKEEVTILLCYLARAREKWEALIEKDSNSIKNNTKKKVNILIADNPKDLLQKMDSSDVLYIAGGEAEFIEPVYKDLVDLKEKIKGKVYAGSSMGAFFASERYVLSLDSQDSNTVHKGIGMLPIQILCHWDIETEKERKLKLLTDGSEMPTLVLNEFESVVIYK